LPPIAGNLIVRGNLLLSNLMRYKGRTSDKAIEREFPHVVEIAVPLDGLGKWLNAMHDFHDVCGIKACLGRGRREDSQDYLRWYFVDAKTAMAFADKFGGKLSAVTPKVDKS